MTDAFSQLFHPDLGRLALAVALAATLAHGAVSVQALRTGEAAWTLTAKRLAVLGFVGCAFAMAVLIAAFLASDFSVENVAQNSHVAKPLIYKIAGAWGSHEGSMVLWCAVLTGVTALIAHGRVEDALRLRAGVAMAGIAGAYLAFAALASSPFVRLDPAPWAGTDLNPLLQDPALAAHPPMLYLGYVGLAAPFAFAFAGLWKGGDPKAWATAMRPWALGAFAALTLGIGLGSFWAYYELGWGGWWFWDPVENASLMPWLLAAALLHSTVVTARTGALSAWTALLALLAFGLSMLGAFLVRSGVLTSVHAFALDPARGMLLLLIMAGVLGAGLALYAWRAQALMGAARPFDAVSRESALVANNVLFVSAAAVVLLGTLFPLITEAVGAGTATVGGPYFNATAAPLMALPLAVAPIATALAWRRGGLLIARERLGLASLMALAAGVGVFALASGAKAGAAAAAALGVWVILGAGLELARQAGGWDGLKRLSARAWGGALAHAGVGLMVLGIAGDAGFPIERHALMAPGDTLEFAGGTMRFDRLESAEGPNYVAERAVLVWERPGREAKVFTPERRYFPAAGMETPEVDLRWRPQGDIYVAISAPSPAPDGSLRYPVRLMINPLMWAVFAGMVLTAAGAAVSGVAARAPKTTPAVQPKSASAPEPQEAGA